MNGPEDAVAVGGGPGDPGASGWGAVVKAGGPAQVASSGPKAVKVTMPVGAAAPLVPVTVAVSVIDPPTVTVGVAWVATVATGATTTDASEGSSQAVVPGA